jgi:hypothetical protein
MNGRNAGLKCPSVLRTITAPPSVKELSSNPKLAVSLVVALDAGPATLPLVGGKGVSCGTHGASY